MAEEAPSSTWYDGKDTQTQTTNGSPNEIFSPHNSSKTSTSDIHKPQHPPKYKKNDHLPIQSNNGPQQTQHSSL